MLIRVTHLQNGKFLDTNKNANFSKCLSERWYLIKGKDLGKYNFST